MKAKKPSKMLKNMLSYPMRVHGSGSFRRDKKSAKNGRCRMSGKENIKPCANTDKELWREPTDEIGLGYYSNAIHVTENGGIGINVGGTVIVKPLAEWHKAASRYDEIVEALSQAHAAGVREGIEKAAKVVQNRFEARLQDQTTQEPDTGEVNMSDETAAQLEELEEVENEIRALIKE